MNIERRRSNFAQFCDDLWLVADHDGTRIEFDVCQSELVEFAANMIDLAVDCLRKAKSDTDAHENVLIGVMDGIYEEVAK